LTPDHVLFNDTGGGHFNPSSSHHTVSGDFLAVGAKVTWNDVTIHGRLFGGARGRDFQLNSGSILGPSIMAPEPSTALVALASLFAQACAAGVRRIRHRPSGPPLPI
jgi:hypothetical protein